MLTDSGGYQIFSMGHGSVSNEVKGKRNAAAQGWVETLIKIDEGGATFRSYINGQVQCYISAPLLSSGPPLTLLLQVHTLTPESSMQVQQKLGADLVVVLDECTPFHGQCELVCVSDTPAFRQTALHGSRSATSSELELLSAVSLEPHCSSFVYFVCSGQGLHRGIHAQVTPLGSAKPARVPSPGLLGRGS
jgi:hypothetical protein